MEPYGCCCNTSIYGAAAPAAHGGVAPGACGAAELAARVAAITALQTDVDQNEVDSDAGIASNLALLNAQRALEWDAVFATHGSLYATTTTVG